MRITPEKNLAFKNQPKPLLTSEVAKSVKTRRAADRLEGATLEFGVVVPADADVHVESVRQRGTRATRNRAQLLKIKVDGVRLGEHVFPPALPSVGLAALASKGRPRRAFQTEGFCPKHLDLRPSPARLPRALEVAPRMVAFPSESRRERGHQPTTIFAPDNRMVFADTSYPWGTCGRVDTPGGSASGVLVGPRHLLTCSHAIQWNDDRSAGWVRFRPGMFDTSSPFGEAWGVRVFYKVKVSGLIDFVEGMFDYVVVVLDTRIGERTGWMGARGYTDAWDGGTYWAHVGYPGDLFGANRPTFQNAIALDGAWWQFDWAESMAHRADVFPGQSGGPFFGWWRGDVGPRAVAVQSSQNSDENYASGGQDMVDLIIQARSAHP